MQIHGAGHCGAVSFTADIDPSRVVLCHCTDCQMMSGSAFRMTVLAWVRSAMPWLHGLADLPASAEQQALLPPGSTQPAVQRES